MTDQNPKSTLPNSREPDLRGRILEAATRLFAQQGYGSTSVRQVVEAVGCTKPALYYHFGSKDALFVEIVHTTTAMFTDIISVASAQPGTVRQRLKHFIQLYVERVLAHPLQMRLLMTAQHRTEKGQPEIDVMSLHRHNGRLMGELLAEGVRSGEIREDIPIQDITLALIGMVNMRVMACLHEPDHAHGIEARILDIFFDGVTPPGGTP